MKNKIGVIMLSCAMIVAGIAEESKADSVTASTAIAGSILLAPHASNEIVKLPESVGNLVVKSVESSGKFTVTLLEDVSNGVEYSLKSPSEIVGSGLNIVGDVITVSSSASGKMLMHSGKAIAFLPNELAKGLIHNSEHE